MTLRELLADAIKADGRSLNEITRAAGLGPSVLSRYVRPGAEGRRDMTTESVDRLLAALGKQVRLVKAKGD